MKTMELTELATKYGLDFIPQEEPGVKIHLISDFGFWCEEQPFAEVVGPDWTALFCNNPCCGQGMIEVRACGNMQAAREFIVRCKGRGTGFGLREEAASEVNWLDLDIPGY